MSHLCVSAHYSERRFARFSALRSIQQQQANRSKHGSHNVRIIRELSLEKDDGIMSRVTVIMTSRKVMRIWQKIFFQQFSVHSQKIREIEIKTSDIRQEIEKIFTKFLNEKLTRPFEEREWLSKNCMKLKLRLKQEIEKREIPTLLFRRSIQNLNLNDFNYTKSVDGQIRLRETRLAFMIGIEKYTLPRKSCKGLLRNWRLEKYLLRRNRSSKTSKNWWIIFASREES